MTTYSCADNITWTVEQQGLLLFQRDENRYHWLSYPEAAVWDLITRERSRPKLLVMLAMVGSMDSEDAAVLLDACLCRWCTNGWLVRRE